ncbi:hypothetical protein [Cryobacterium arcticum]|uniref:Uncharacterized protein n=1 Tax=Cryobacterium arcticum TaxID=670052 RepID=A0A317ZQS1_9MICO|nr:hypothetical protein [Cryobacterium arcticum]PXA67479.1 hypothetical protein CTB96_12195 [Cryobacterium arcticum]
MTTKAALKPADQIHFVESGLTLIVEGQRSVPHAISTHRGQTVTISQALLDANKNRFGECWLDLDADAQIKRYGREMFRRGPAPEGMPAYTSGSVEESIARDKARAQADTLPHDQRAAAHLEVIRVFGRKVTSQTIGETR